MNDEPMEEDSSGVVQALVELAGGSDREGEVELHMGEAGPAISNTLEDSQHGIREDSEEEARLLCATLDKEGESDCEQENEREEEEDTTEDSDGEEDGWNKIEFTQVANLIDWGKRVMSKKTKPWWKGDSTREI